MQLHAGVARNHHAETHRRYGPDTGHDIRALCPIPTRHDMNRRLDAGHLAELVLDHHLD